MSQGKMSREGAAVRVATVHGLPFPGPGFSQEETERERAREREGGREGGRERGREFESLWLEAVRGRKPFLRLACPAFRHSLRPEAQSFEFNWRVMVLMCVA